MMDQQQAATHDWSKNTDEERMNDSTTMHEWTVEDEEGWLKQNGSRRGKIVLIISLLFRSTYEFLSPPVSYSSQPLMV